MLTPFSLFKPSPSIPKRPGPGAQAKAAQQLDVLWIWFRGRFKCSGNYNQWKLQAVDAAAVRGRTVPRLRRHMPPYRACGGALRATIAARTSRSHANSPDLATQCCGRRARKSQNSKNHSHFYTPSGAQARY